MDKEFEKDVLLCKRDWVRSVLGFHTPGHLFSSKYSFFTWQSFCEPRICQAVWCDGVGMQSPLKIYWTWDMLTFTYIHKWLKKPSNSQVYFKSPS